MSSSTGTRYADSPATEVSTWIAARPHAVWKLISDITLMPALSDELQAVEWLPPATTAALGAAFRGYNGHGSGRWSTVSHIVAYRVDREFAWAVGSPGTPAAIWRFTLQPEEAGTRLTQGVQMGPGRSGISAVIDEHPDQEQAIVAGRLRNFRRGMTRNLAAIKSLAEASTTPPQQSPPA